MANLAGWPYWKVISITGQAGSGTHYQVELEIGDSAGGDFHLEGHCTNFPQDIRITDDDGTTLLDYWIEDITADPIVVHVEVKDDLGSNRDIRVYYGKSGETTASDGATTFPLFDHFGGSSIDGGIWGSEGTIEVSSSEATLNADDALKSIATFGYGYAAKIKAKADEQDTVFLSFKDFFNIGTSSPTPYAVLILNSDGDYADDFDHFGMWTYINGSIYKADSDNQLDFRNVYRTYEMTRKSGEVKHYQDDNLMYTRTTHLPTSSLSIGMEVWDSSQASTLTVDWIFIRKFNSPGPAFSSAGAEQTPGLVSVFIRHNPALTGGMV